ncbi:MAG: transglutaminase TgpA family protein [Actinomycetota bacterium]
MAEPDRRNGLPPELGVAALVVAASLPLGRLFRSSEIGALAIAASATSTAVAWGLRRLRAPAILAAAASFAAFLWFASFAFFRDAMFGPFPSPRSLSLIWDAAVEGIKRSQTDAAPVAAATAFMCLAAFAIWATAWLADDAANKLRHPMLAIGVTVPLFVLPGTILEGDRRWLDAGAYLAGAMWVLFADERFRLSRWGRVVGLGSPGWRPGLAARIGTLAILIAIVGTPILPGFSAPPGLRGTTGGGDRVALNPLVSIRPQLNQDALTEVMTVRSRAASYWRMTALDRFDGLTWSSGPQRPQLALGERQIQPQSTSPAGTLVTQEYEIHNLAGPWVPAAFEPVRVQGLRGVGADPATRTVIIANDMRGGTRYTVRSRIPALSYDELDLAPRAVDPALNAYLQVPASPQMDRVRQVALEIVRSAEAAGASPFRQAVALQDHLRNFEYDEDVALAHNIRDIADFLTRVKSGYCEQFATSMAVMARLLGLPSRVAIGFAIGTTGVTPDVYEVTSRHAHAWVEIWMTGFGWVTFEPTPRGDAVQVPRYTAPPSSSTPQTNEATPTSQETVDPEASATARDPESFDPPTSSGGGVSAVRRLVQVGVVAGILLASLVIAVPVAALVRRVIRHRRAKTSQAKVSARYLDFLDWCAAVRLERGAGETPYEHAVRLAKVSSDVAPKLGALAALGTDAVYAPRNGLDPAEAAKLARDARRSVARTLPRRSRVLSRVGWGWWRTDPQSGPTPWAKQRSARIEP